MILILYVVIVVFVKLGYMNLFDLISFLFYFLFSYFIVNILIIIIYIFNINIYIAIAKIQFLIFFS